MKIHSLKVRGAIGFKKGLGLDEIEVDFKGLNGLVALAGQNGFGKTTLLENLSPYRQFASRSGALRHHFFLRDSFRDLTFEYGGDVYRTLVKIDAESDRTEGYVWKNDQPMIDGKVTNYSRYIENLLGSSNLFYNSVFCAQNAAKMSDMTTGDLKKLFVELLRLDRLAGYEQAAKQCGNVLDGQAQAQHKTIENLQERMLLFQGLYEQIRQARASKEAGENRLVEINGKINQRTQDIERLTDIEAKNSVNIERRQDLEKDIKTLRDERKDRFDDYRDKQKRLGQDLRAKQSSLKSCQDILKDRDAIAKASDKAKTIEGKLTRTRERDAKMGKNLEVLFEKGMDKGREIQEAKDSIRDIGSSKALKKLADGTLRTDAALKNIQSEIDKLSRKRDEAEQSFELVQIDSDIKSCKEAMTLLDQRGECPVENPICSFVLSAIEAGKRLTDLEKKRLALIASIAKEVENIEAVGMKLKTDYDETSQKLSAQKQKYNNLEAQDNQAISKLKVKIKALEDEQENSRGEIRDIRKVRTEKQEVMDALSSDLKEARALSEKLPGIQKVETQIEQLTKDIQTLEVSIQASREEYDKEDALRRSKLHDVEKRLASVSKLIDEDAGEKLAKARERLSVNRKEKDRISDEIKGKDELIATLKQRLEEKATIEKEIARAQDELGRVTAESSQWRYLQNACGKSGLQALEIDGVAPLITGYANDLLTSTFGPNFSVRLITQDPETGKEILDIVVIRGDGSETSLENLSGGEKVWVLKSLRLAMTLVSKQKSGRDFKTILADEEDGPLDVEKAQSFVGLYKAILGVGGFNSCFYISHNPEVVGMADHQVLFSREGIRVA